jgi:hypothetical protein
MTETTRNYPLAANTPFRKAEHQHNIITFYPKTAASWEQINTFLEDTFPEGHWTWQGFGKVGSPEFQVIVVRKPYDDYGDDEDEDSDDE